MTHQEALAAINDLIDLAARRVPSGPHEPFDLHIIMKARAAVGELSFEKPSVTYTQGVIHGDGLSAPLLPGPTRPAPATPDYAPSKSELQSEQGYCPQCDRTDDEIEILRTQINDYRKCLDDHDRLVRELDVALNGDAGAAKQASLCDIVSQVKHQEWKLVKVDDLIKRRKDARYGAFDEARIYCESKRTEWRNAGHEGASIGASQLAAIMRELRDRL